MSAVDFFNAARAYRRELTGTQDGLTDEDVRLLNAATADRWKPASGISGAATAATGSSGQKIGAAGHISALSDPAKFFASVREQFGGLEQGQVDGINRLLKPIGADGWPISWAAYGLATPWWETNKQMHPVEEGYYLGAARAKAHQRSLRYYPWYGRGDVQLTWEKNYRDADAALGLGGRLVADPNLALDPETSARILVWGMRGGKFTTKGLGDYLPAHGPADVAQFTQARRIINGQDKASEIAIIATKFQKALQAGGWA